MSPSPADGRQLIRANGIDVYCDIRVRDPSAVLSPWVVLSHSLACDHTMWDEQTALLESNYRVLRFDTRGHGRSSAPQGPYTLELLADDLKALLRALRIERPHFVGLSMGGMIGQTLAARDPEVFRTITLCDTTSFYPPGTAAVWQERIRVARANGMAALVESTLARWFTADFRRDHPAVMQRFSALISRTPVEGYAGCSQALVQINVTAALKKLAMPGLVIVGEHDPGTPVAMARVIVENLPGSRLEVIPGAAHISNVEQPQAFNRVLIDFLKRND